MVKARRKDGIIPPMIDLSVGRVKELTIGGEPITKQGMNDYTVGIKDNLSFDQAVEVIFKLVKQGYELKGGL